MNVPPPPPRRPIRANARLVAIRMLERGFWPVPIWPKGAEIACGSNYKRIAQGKEPMGSGWGATKRTIAELNHTYARINDAGVGVCLGPGRGPGGGWLIDIEGDGPKAEESRLALFDGQPFVSIGWKSFRGFHYLYLADRERLLDMLSRLERCEGVTSSLSGVYHLPGFPDLELRVGGENLDGSVKQIQSVCPPTPSSDGKPREWIGSGVLIHLPDSFYAIPDRLPRAAPAPHRVVVETPIPCPAGKVEAYGLAALVDECNLVAGSTQPGRHIQLNRSAFKIGSLVEAGAIDDSIARSSLIQAGLRCGLPEWEVRETVQDALVDGARKRRVDLSHVGQPQPANGNGHVAHHEGLIPPVDGPPPENVPDIAVNDQAPNEANNDPHRLARLYRDLHCSHPDGPTLRFYKGAWVRWENGAYRQLDKNELKNDLVLPIKSEFDHLNIKAIETWESNGRCDKTGRPSDMPVADRVTDMAIRNVAINLAGLLSISPKEAPTLPSWLGGELPFPAAEVLPTRDSLIHLPSLVKGLPCKVAPTPKFLSMWALDYGFNPDAPEPIEWTKFLRTVWPNDPESIDTLQEWFGYVLTHDTRQQKILVFIGPRRGGKGTIARVLREMIGVENVAGPTLSSLATNFGLAPLIGKPLAIVPDARITGRTDQAQIIELLLAISGEDTLTADRKHIGPWTGKIGTRLMMLSNELPRFIDASQALAGRMLILKFRESFIGREDFGLFERLKLEMPGILNWAIEGWQRLTDRGRFVQPEQGADLVAEMEDLSSPVGAFVRECCELGEDKEVEVKDLFACWKAYCEEQGRIRVMELPVFCRDLLTAFPMLDKARQRKIGGVKTRYYTGIGLTDEAIETMTSWRHSHV